MGITFSLSFSPRVTSLTSSLTSASRDSQKGAISSDPSPFIKASLLSSLTSSLPFLGKEGVNHLLCRRPRVFLSPETKEWRNEPQKCRRLISGAEGHVSTAEAARESTQEWRHKNAQESAYSGFFSTVGIKNALSPPVQLYPSTQSKSDLSTTIFFLFPSQRRAFSLSP